MTESTIPGFRSVPRTGVIYVMHRAEQRGFRYNNPDWANLGQGAPETGPLPGSPPRVDQISINPNHHEYGPITGQITLRQKVADLYNHLYRQGKPSQYTYENVSISGGGRVALTRLAAALGNINMGHFLPDYTAYEELLSVFKAFIPIPILLDSDQHYRADLGKLKREIMGRGLQALLASNPCNPTGQVTEGEDLRDWVQMAREYRCSLILDEFYSHYVYTGAADGPPKLVSAAAYVEDVNRDPVIVVDGLTKNWRYPGWRISWTVGPKEVINTIASAGSFLDGGANNPFQRHVLDLLDPALVMQETAATQSEFRKKRDYMMARLHQMGIQVEAEPQGTFYCWANLSELPPPINEGMPFFQAGLEERVITVPGLFFDVNPEKRRSFARYRHYCRISFGPEMEKLEQGLDGLERVIAKYG
ncbi:MAG: pyridoxal phosphate-dependent aminotransferase [Ardenticatenaceae bacterium]|nr:pyridoxal phosphate-dependent aminotransferase [Anaerolineales bacterium]MCB8921779.1 pyridoxal phosphate-dependent aminotransferase [Ardenticatenaceae bacterium]MCB8990702.1 pyridoxal phosphate-dependent aminotransferase [Ardenticatenaceae bacterium]